MEKLNYFQQRNIKNNKELLNIEKELPYFCDEFFMGIESKTTPLTRLGYAQDLKRFFIFLTTQTTLFSDKKPNEITLNDMNKLTETHIEKYMIYLNSYENTSDNKTYVNSVKTKARKFSSIRTMLRYFYKKGKLEQNVSERLDSPKLREKEIIKLEPNEVTKLLEAVENGENLSPSERKYHKINCVRDYAIMSLFLGTGIRISELVGLDVNDVDFSQNAFTITRKGGARVILYFNEEVKQSLLDYLNVRNHQAPTDEQAFFLSMQQKRMTTRAVEKLVKKYCRDVTPLKKITPHKLRSTFGTNLYRETGDIYVVASVLGHKDVNTTKKYYAAITDDIRRAAANKVKLRKD
ncbi:MAG: tyrosine-type recombinase/integrase [Clostridiales bacterium]|nr:tyrosine-type recombinase/integrase [Candidatus Apopatousia equi]